MMNDDRDELAPTVRVRQYRAEIARILDALGHPEALVTDESRLSDFPIREDDEVSLIDLASDLGIRVRPQDRLIDIARRMRQLADRQIAAGTPEARHRGPAALADAGH
jgi:hypothetical protein